REEGLLVDLALAAEHAETRIAAAERVQTREGLQRLADAAKDTDRGVSRLARQRINAIRDRLRQQAQADAILGELEALAIEPGPILSAVVRLNRRWQAAEMSLDAARLARCDAARQTIQARFDREQEEQRSRAQFERRLLESMAALGSAAPATADALARLREELAALREEAQQRSDGAALARLEQAEQRIALWEQERQALAGAEALVVEAEQLAAGTSIDHAELPSRWQALDRAIRTPDLTRRFEAAMTTVEQRRLAQVEVARQEANAARQRLHALLHAAEQALVAGQLQAARAAVDDIRMLKAPAGPLPKPTTQRLNRFAQQLAELERWETFGQRIARLRLCERAEALPAQTTEAPKLALEVQKLRNEWKALDQQHAGVPKSLWERFDAACEKAYAPAARHFAEVAARKKQARQRREDFIAAAAAHAPTLLGETPDWRANERWLRETDQAWSGPELGGVDPGAWKKLDQRLKAALAPLREALSAARERAKADRKTLIAEAAALASKALERDTPSQLKAIQARWQEQAKALSLLQRDERALWEQFRAACDAVFHARQAQRRQEDDRKHGDRRTLEDLCAQLEQLALAADRQEQDIRRSLGELQEQWKKKAAGLPLREVESRFRKASTAVEAMLSARARSRKTAVWQTLASKERLCEELDGLVQSACSADFASRSAAAQEQWQALPALPGAWEQKMIVRRDAALRALSDAAASGEYVARVERGADSRRESLLELELLLELESPAEFQAQRRALQLKRLKQRFDRTATAGDGTAVERLLAWCAQPGVADALDRERCERIFSMMARAGAKT
ncbi:MAG: hypothetical protein A3G27_06970, partial [Betaproteobacteria bacterium RIFCSPLOWO2_12_FULL_66_14]